MGTLTFEGTGGVIEGNLGTANVNVNLDSTLLFDSNDDKITTGNLGSLGQATSLSSFAWVKLDATPSTSQYIWSTLYAPVNFVFSGANGLRFQGKRGDTDALASVDSSGPFAFTTGDWYHVGFTYDNSSRAVLFYINGVQYAGGTFPAALKNVNADLLLGNYGAGTNMIQGNLADVKIFNSVVSATDAKILAAKINQDPTLTSANANVIGWWKINEGTGTTINDFTNDTNGGTDHNGTLANGTWQYDQYSVDVYDNSTTTDGTFTITQGKVECKALSSVLLDGDSDLVTCTSNTFYNSKTAFSVSAWIRPDANNISFQTVVNARDSGNDGMALSVLNQTVRLRIGDGGSDDLVTGNVITSADRWYHLVATRDASNNTAIYVDGVLSTTGSSSKTISVSSGNFGIGGRPSATDADEFDGKIRNVGCWSYDLSAEQVASLYSNTYPQTPSHQYKLDEGTGATANDTGTETAANGSLLGNASLGGAGHNQTLDLDGNLTIATNGTLSAPSHFSKLDCNAAFTDNGTFTHNSGEVIMRGSGTDIDGSATTTFYNLTSENFIDVTKSINVENKMKATGSNSWRFVTNQTITMGTATSAGEIETGTASGKGMRFTNINKTYKFEAVNPELFPWVGTDGGAGWNNGETGNTIELKGCDMQFDLNTQGSGGDEPVTWKLTGDCEFDAVTVSSGDTLDLNSQRAEFGGNFSLTGTLSDTGNAGIAIFKGTYTRSGTKADLNTGTVFMVEGAGSSDYHDPVPDKFFVNTGSGTVTLGNPLEEAASGTADVIIGSGTVNANNQNISGRDDITIGHDATYTAGSSTINCKGDFYTSGGIIGKSAGEFVTDDGQTNHNYITAGSSANSDGWTNITVETWVKLDHLGNQSSEATFFSRGANSNPKFGLLSGKLRLYSPYGNLSGNATLTTGKWFHVACSYNSSGVAKLYIDGKLDAQATIATNILSATSDVGASMIGAQQEGSRAMDGLMGKISIWNHELTQPEIRELMFMTGAEMQAASTFSSNKNDCKFFYEFNEGTGATIEDTGPGGNNGTWGHNNGGTAALWAGAGGFSFGTSTLTMKGSGSQKIYTAAGEVIYALTVNAGSTTDIECKGSDAGSPFMPTHNVTINGTLSSTSVPLYMINNFVSNGGAFSFGGSADLTGLNSIRCVHTSGTIDIPAVTTKILQAEASGGTTRATGDLTLTSELDVSNGATFNGNGNTINVKALDVNGASTLNLSNTTVNFNVTSSGDTLSIEETATLSTGNTTIVGHSSQQTPAVLPPNGGFEVVGNISNLKIMSDGDLTVVGSVTNCLLQTDEGNIRQFVHTLDTQQLLDADEGGDDDLKLPRPSLDNALQLQTGG